MSNKTINILLLNNAMAKTPPPNNPKIGDRHLIFVANVMPGKTRPVGTAPNPDWIDGYHLYQLEAIAAQDIYDGHSIAVWALEKNLTHEIGRKK